MSNLKLAFIFIFVAIHGLAITNTHAQSRVVRVGIFQNSPMVYTDKAGKIVGIYADILNEVARLENWKLEYVSGSFAEGLEALLEGRIDLMTVIAATPQRREFIDFSEESIVSIWGQLYVREGFKPENIIGLAGKKIAVLRSGILGAKFAELCRGFDVDCQILPTASYDETLQAVHDGEADGAVVNSIFGFSKESQYNVVRSSIVFTPFHLYIGAPKGRNSELVAAVDHHMAEWRDEKESFYYKTIDRWLGLKPGVTNTIPVWVWWTLLGGVLLIVLVFLWVTILRKEVQQRKMVENELRLTEQRLKLAAEAGGIGLWELNLVDHTTWRSLIHDRIFGYEALLPKWTYDMFLEHVIPEDRADVDGTFQLAISTQSNWNFECRILLVNGEMRWIWGACEIQGTSAGQIPSMAGIVVDISERKLAEKALADSERQFRSLIEETANMLPWRFDLKEGRFTFVGHQSETMLGFPVESWTDLDSWSSRIHPDDRHQAAEFCLISTEKGEDHEFEYRCITASGEVVWLRDIVTVRKDDNSKPVELIGHILDITEHKRVEARLETLATTDGLTSLYSRIYFDEKLEDEVQRAIRFKTPLSLLMLDIDYFKNVNDTYGHQAGDACLVALADLMRGLSRTVDTCTRYGGEEFIIILPQTPSENAMDFAKRLLKKVEALKVQYDGQTIKYTISIGIDTLNLPEKKTADEMLKAVDSALYEAKENGRNCISSGQTH